MEKDPSIRTLCSILVTVNHSDNFPVMSTTKSFGFLVHENTVNEKGKLKTSFGEQFKDDIPRIIKTYGEWFGFEYKPDDEISVGDEVKDVGRLPILGERGYWFPRPENIQR